jgi:hypothetical protein
VLWDGVLHGDYRAQLAACRVDAHLAGLRRDYADISKCAARSARSAMGCRRWWTTRVVLGYRGLDDVTRRTRSASGLAAT